MGSIPFKQQYFVDKPEHDPFFHENEKELEHYYMKAKQKSEDDDKYRLFWLNKYQPNRQDDLYRKHAFPNHKQNEDLYQQQ